MIVEGKIRILIVEDDEILLREICTFLRRWGYETGSVRDFQDILADFSRYQPHLVLLDINLPFFDGFYWCSKIRAVSNVPIVFISSRGDDRDKIMGIAQGGDDYVEKPFRLELLKAKVEAILRRTYQYTVSDRVYLGEELYFESSVSALIYKGQEAELTRSEKRILSRLLKDRPNVVTREELMMELWSTDEFVSDGTLTTLVSRLRSKLKDFCGSQMIATRKGQGYYIEKND